MGQHVTRKLDVEKIDAALKRAARAAVSGGRTARSGRIVSDKLVKLSAVSLTQAPDRPKRRNASASQHTNAHTKKSKR